MMIMMKCSGCLLQHSAQAFSCFGNSSTVLNTSFSLSLINFLLPLSLRIFLNWSLFSLLAVLDPRLLSPYPEHLPPHLSKITNRSFQHAAPRLWNELRHSFREPHPHPGLSSSHYRTQVGSTLSSPPLSPSITIIFFTLDLKHTSSSSLFHLRLHHRYSLDWSHGLPAGPFSFAHRFCFSF